MNKALLKSEIDSFITHYHTDCILYARIYLDDPVKHNFYLNKDKKYTIAYIDNLIKEFVKNNVLNKSEEKQFLTSVFRDFELLIVDFSKYNTTLNSDNTSIEWKVEFNKIKKSFEDTIEYIKERIDKTILYEPVIANIYDAINFYMGYHEKLLVCYFQLIEDTKKKGAIDIEANKHINELTNKSYRTAITTLANKKTENNENKKEAVVDTTLLKAESINLFNSLIFTEYVDKFISETSDKFELEKAYHIISTRLDELKPYHVKMEFNPDYKFTWFSFISQDDTFYVLSDFLIRSQAEKMYFERLNYESDQYENLDVGFTADKIFNTIIEDFEQTKSKIDNSFSFLGLIKANKNALNRANGDSIKTIKKVFISHSSKDKKEVGALIDLIEGIGLKANQIFCSSFEGYGVALGEGFIERLKKELSDEILVFFILTNNFYSSPISLCEMGATWIKTNKHIHILVPPFEFNDVKGVFPVTNGMKIDDKNKLNSLKETLESDFALTPLSSTIWEKKRDTFLNTIN